MAIPPRSTRSRQRPEPITPTTRPLDRPRTDSRPPITKGQILRTAARLFSTKGLSATGTHAIASELGVQSPAILDHFKSKDELLEELYDVLMAPALDFYERLRGSGLKPAEQLYRCLLVDVHAGTPPDHHRGPDRIPASRHQPDRGQTEYRGRVRHHAALGAAPRPRRHHGRRNP